MPRTFEHSSVSTELYRALFEESTDGMLIVDDNGLCVAVNRRAAEMTGQPRERLIGMRIADLIAEQDESAIRRKDGGLIPVEIRTPALSDGHLLVVVRDLTYSRQLEALRKSEATCRALVELADDPMFTTDAATGRYTYVNPVAASLLGKLPDEVVGKTPEELFPPDVAKTYSAGVRHVVETGETLRAHEQSEVNGQRVWFSSVVQPVRDRQGRITAVQAVVRDITKIKLAEEALRESEERLRQAVRVSNIGIFDHDHVTGALFYSPEQREICGLDMDEPISFASIQDRSRGTWDLAHPEDQERVAAALRAAHDPAGDGLFDLDHRIIRPDGSVRWLTTRSQTFFEGEGSARRPARTVGAVRDITSLKNAEQALCVSEERLRQVISFSHIGVFDHDHIGNGVYMSSSLRHILGVGNGSASATDLIATEYDLQRFLQATHPDDRERMATEIRRAHGSSDGIFDVEVRVIAPDGSIRWMTVQSRTTFTGEGSERRPVRTVGAIVDITERKIAEDERQRLQTQLLQAQKMESIGRLAGGVAHDFNNMLNIICGYAELTLDQLDASHPLHGSIDEIRKAGRRSAELTSQLLAFARKQPIAPKVVYLNDHIERSLNMVRRLIGENIRAAWMPDPDLWAVRVDPVQIDQILVNLLVNARDAISGFGRVTIVTSNVILDEEQCKRHPGSVPGTYVSLEVTDDGNGMDAETKSHIFEPFYTTKGDGQGTGLGLATVYGIVKQNRGSIIVSSEVGRGTSVQILFPRFTGAAARTVLPKVEGPKKGTETVLLVEDEPMVLGLSKHMLETLGYTVLPAGTPNEAMRLAREKGESIQLLLTDVVMPEMNGPDLAKRLLSMHPHLKCMFVSGYFSGSTTMAGVLDEGAHFLQKPFSVTDLASRVRDALEAP